MCIDSSCLCCEIASITPTRCWCPQQLTHMASSIQVEHISRTAIWPDIAGEHTVWGGARGSCLCGEVTTITPTGCRKPPEPMHMAISRTQVEQLLLAAIRPDKAS